MNKTLKRHLEAIQSGTVSKGNVIGLRKALNTQARQGGGWSISSTAPKVTLEDVMALEGALVEYCPKADEGLHKSGLEVLRNRRYAKRLEGVADIIEAVKRFELIRYDYIGRGYHTVPVWRVVGEHGGTFTFRNIPWQSGGDGPEVLGHGIMAR